ncbi:MAG: UDP-N-acetylmuramate dehydrogenase [Candidatus Gracilibacteria bacterium]
MELREDHNLAPYCTFQIGGPADFFVEARGSEEVLEALNWAEERDLPVFVFGGGSNLLFDDGGFRGLVIRMRLAGVEVRGEEVWAEAGVMMAKVVLAAAEAGLTGLEAWNGLPGTVGGAVFGNAGCFGVEAKDVLESAEVWMPGEGVKTVGVEFFEYDYRWSRLKKEGGVVLSASFKLQRGERGEILEKMKEIARSRISKQPPGSSTGSFFKNPPGDHAGRLIEAAGLKGKWLGKARISDQHANFFLNAGGATAADILNLAALVEKTVFEKFGIRLEREVVFVPSEGRGNLHAG